MTRKYISTELLIIFTALMIIANFYYIFFEKIGYLFILLLGCILIYVGYLYFHKVRGLLAFLDRSTTHSVYLVIQQIYDYYFIYIFSNNHY